MAVIHVGECLRHSAQPSPRQMLLAGRPNDRYNFTNIDRYELWAILLCMSRLILTSHP